jgi:hypothetical protein
MTAYFQTHSASHSQLLFFITSYDNTQTMELWQELDYTIRSNTKKYGDQEWAREDMQSTRLDWR